MPRTPKVIPRQLPTGKWHIDTTALGPRYRETWDTEALAIRDAERIKRQIAGVGLMVDDLRAYDAAAHSLGTVECPGKGKDIAFVISWFQENYVGSNSQRALKEWATEYVEEKKLVVETKTLREIQQYLTDHYMPLFGHLTPMQVSTTSLKTYLAENTSRWHRDKVLRNFFAWLAGEECKNMATLEHAPLKKSPFVHITKLAYERARDEVVILYIAELKAAIKIAIEKHPECLGQLVFQVLTGLRPDCEAPPFWTSGTHGWRRIDFRRRLLTVTKELEKTGKRSRHLVMVPNLISWLEYFQKHSTQMTCTRYAWRLFKKAAFPERAQKVQDLLRHTALSNYAKKLPEFELERQFATSDDMLMEHYLSQIADEAEIEEFFSFTPATFGLV
jgi:hypothetical protein